MPQLKLTLEYDGTDFVGWQFQKNGRSVQEVFERALKVLLGTSTPTVAAGRTDSGVHARGQVVSFRTERVLPPRAYGRGLNGILPDDVAVVTVESVPDEFDARRWALGKRYRYVISNLPERSPARRRSHWEVFAPLDGESMTRALPALIGRHDFSAFRASDCQAHHAVRNVRELVLSRPTPDTFALEVAGSAFLKHMVRNIVGSLVEVGKGRHPPEWMAEVLAGRDRVQAGPTAPPQGLTLMSVEYGPGRPPHLRAPVLPDPGEVD